MTDPTEELAQVERAAKDLIPQLTQRLQKSGLGELEIRSGSLRVRVAARGRETVGIAPAAAVAAPASSQDGVPSERRDAEPGAHPVTSPAVGFFGYAEALGPGLQVEKGDELGHVEMLGVRHDVRAPRRGTVRHLVSEAGEPVEYGQVLIEMEPAE